VARNPVAGIQEDLVERLYTFTDSPTTTQEIRVSALRTFKCTARAIPHCVRSAARIQSGAHAFVRSLPTANYYQNEKGKTGESSSCGILLQPLLPLVKKLCAAAPLSCLANLVKNSTVAGHEVCP
jgi:hypothetical protein